MRRTARFRVVGATALTAALVMTLAIASTASAVPAGAAHFDLFAGQSEDVGDIFVWNDATNYYVKIKLADGWCMSESHVAAAATLDGIPQANGNPVPGKFPMGDTYDPCASKDKFTIPIADVGANPYVAVHAKVWEKVVSTATIVSDAGDPVRHATTYADFGAPVPGVVSTFAGWPAIAGASYISNQAAGDPFNENHWRMVNETLAVPGLPLGGELWVNSDNYEFTKLNGTEVERDDDGPAATVENSAPEVVVPPQTWQVIQHVAFAPVKGDNAFEFVFRNTPWEGCCGFIDNPTGLAYKATADYYAHGETAWAGTSDFEGKNWATYFRVAFQPVLVETLTVPATAPGGIAGVDSSVLASGTAYLFKVTGTTTWLNRGGTDVVDAECVNTSGGGWTQGVAGYPADLLNLQVDQVSVDWEPVGAANVAGCADGNEYTFGATGAGVAVNFRIYDGTGNVQDPGWFGDNSGSLTVQIWQTAP